VVTYETAANNRNALNKDDGVCVPEPPGEQVQHSHRADDSSEEKTEENDHQDTQTSHGAEKKEAKEEENNEERDERASSDSSSSSEDGEVCRNGRLEEEFPGFLTMLQLPGFPGTRTAPEPEFPLEMLPHIFVASHASDEVPTGPDEAMGSYECHCSCHQDSCHLCMCSNKRKKYE